MAAIQTKQQFINFLYQFHNSVNASKSYPIFERAGLEEAYEKAILPNIFRNFEIAYKDKAFNPRHIHDEFVRNRVLKSFREWLQRNGHLFV